MICSAYLVWFIPTDILEQFSEVLTHQTLLMSSFTKLSKELLVQVSFCAALLGNLCYFGYSDVRSGFKKDEEIRPWLGLRDFLFV